MEATTALEILNNRIPMQLGKAFGFTIAPTGSTVITRATEGVDKTEWTNPQ